MSSRVSITMRLTAQLRNHLGSAGITYHGACSEEVPRVELPPLRRVGEPRAEPLGLLLARDVEEHLDDADVRVVEERLEVVDVVVARPPHRLRDEVMDAHDQD